MPALDPGFDAPVFSVGGIAYNSSAPNVTPPVNNSGIPALLCSGIMTRSYAQAKQADYRPLIDAFVLSDFAWKDLFPTDTGGINTTAGDGFFAALEWARTNAGTNAPSLPVRVRINAGFLAPAWVKALGPGPLTWYTNHGTDGVPPAAPSDPTYLSLPGGIPWWLDIDVQDAYDDMVRQIADAFGDHPNFAEFNMVLNTTQFEEPCIRQFGSIENKQTAWDNGWTTALDTASFVAGWQSHKDWMIPHDIACWSPWNPSQTIKPKTGGGFTYQASGTLTVQRMELMKSMLGRYAVWCNHSAESPTFVTAGPVTLDEQIMYQRMIDGRNQESPPVAIGFQTKTLVKMKADNATYGLNTTVISTLDMLSSDTWKATCNELCAGAQAVSAGVDYVSPAKAKAYNLKFAANAAPLFGSGTIIVPPPPPPPPGSGWLTPDSSTIAGSDAYYLLVGSLFGDPSGNGSMTNAGGSATLTTGIHLARGDGGSPDGHPTLFQLRDAIIAKGGTATISPQQAGRHVVNMDLAGSDSIFMDLSGIFKLNGVDMFGFVETSPGVWTTTATAKQVRAFLAGYMQGEGNVNGMVGDDPTYQHLEFVQRLMSTDKAYNVPVDITGTNYFQAFVHDSSYYPRVQAYPFIVYGRCPGGAPNTGGGGTGGGGGGTGGGSGGFPNIMIVPMENEGYDITNAGTWPKGSVLASTYAYKTQFYGIAHPSQPNYLHLVSGADQGITDDSLQAGNLTAQTLFDQLTAAGVGWCDYAEDLPSIIYNEKQEAGGDVYIPRHNIISAFSNFAPNNPRVKDSGATSSVGTAVWSTLINDLNSASYPNFVYFAPSAANQGHGTGSPYKDPTTGAWASTAQDADNFLKKFSDAVRATQWYLDGGTIIFIWDEGAGGDTTSGFNTAPFNSGGTNGGGHTNILIVSEAARGKGAVSGLMNAWGMLGDLQDAYGLTTALGRSQGSWGSIAQLFSIRTGG